MQQPDVLDVVPQQDHKDPLIVGAVPDRHNLGYVSRLDVVLVIYLESLQPEQKIANSGYDLGFSDNRFDQSVIFSHLQNIFEEDSQKVRSHISILFLHMTGPSLPFRVLASGRLWFKLSLFFLRRNLRENGSLGHFGAVLVILSLGAGNIVNWESWWKGKA